jgi:hypothetical protein
MENESQKFNRENILFSPSIVQNIKKIEKPSGGAAVAGAAELSQRPPSGLPWRHQKIHQTRGNVSQASQYC